MSQEISIFAQQLKAFFDGIGGGGTGGGRGPGGGDPLPSQFPPGGIDFIQHDLRVTMSSKSGDFSETLVMTGAMVIQRTDPYVGPEKRRQIDFKVLSWAATGWSDKFGAAVTYVLSEGVDQPVSTIVAETERFDFPASFNFKVVFDARLNNETVYPLLAGAPAGHGFMQVPPGGDRRFSPTITRFDDVGLVTMNHPDIGEIVIKPVDCNDRHSQVLRELPGRPLIRPLGLGGGGGGGGGSR
jgi:hypothetical protein